MPVKLDVHLQGYLEQKLLSRLLYFNRLTQKPFQRNINKTQFLNETGICMLNGKWFFIYVQIGTNQCVKRTCYHY